MFPQLFYILFSLLYSIPKNKHSIFDNVLYIIFGCLFVFVILLLCCNIIRKINNSRPNEIKLFNQFMFFFLPHITHNLVTCKKKKKIFPSLSLYLYLYHIDFGFCKILLKHLMCHSPVNFNIMCRYRQERV